MITIPLIHLLFKIDFKLVKYYSLLEFPRHPFNSEYFILVLIDQAFIFHFVRMFSLSNILTAILNSIGQKIKNTRQARSR